MESVVAMTLSADSLGMVTFVDTPSLRIACEVKGNGKPIVLLHGWPDDARTWDAVTGPLVERGFQTITPWMRGCGATGYRDPKGIRSGQVVAFAQDMVDLFDSMHLDRVTFAGQDWGGRTAYALGALFPERIECMVIGSAGYETGIKPGDKIAPQQARAYWYQWFWHTERGREALENNRRDICRLLWQTWGPNWRFSDQEFNATANAWDNPDWVATTLHSYRVRWGAAEPDPRYEKLQQQYEERRKIAAPTIVLHGEVDGASLSKSSEHQEKDFTASYRRRSLPGIGHFIQREKPQAIIDAVLEVTNA